MVNSVLWDAFPSDGVLLDLRVLVTDSQHDYAVLDEVAAGWRSLAALFGLGDLCWPAEFLDLATERWVGRVA